MASIMRTAHRGFNIRHEAISQSRRRQLTEQPGEGVFEEELILAEADPDRQFAPEAIMAPTVNTHKAQEMPSVPSSPRLKAA